MLVVTRKVGEVIRIGADVTITVTEIRAGRVRIGVEAPREVRIERGELAERMVDVHDRDTGGEG